MEQAQKLTAQKNIWEKKYIWLLWKMTDKSEIKELNKHLRESERENRQLKEALEKERSTNDELNNENNNLVL